MKKTEKILLYSILLLLLPLTLQAQVTAQTVIKEVFDIVRNLIVVVSAAALLVFFWGIVKFIANVGSGEEREEAKKIMGWGIIALFVMASFWGIIIVLQNTLLPGVPFDSLPQDINFWRP